MGFLVKSILKEISNFILLVDESSKLLQIEIQPHFLGKKKIIIHSKKIITRGLPKLMDSLNINLKLITIFIYRLTIFYLFNIIILFLINKEKW